MLLVPCRMLRCSKTQGPADKDTKKKLKQKPSQEEEYDLSRYKPLLRTVIEVRIVFLALGPISPTKRRVM